MGFAQTAAAIAAMAPLFALIAANQGAVPAGAPWAPAWNLQVAAAAALFRQEFDDFIQEHLLGVGWPAGPAADPRDVMR